MKEKKINKKIEKPMRQIIIETDGTNIHLVKAEVGGLIELIGILQNTINHLSTEKNGD